MDINKVRAERNKMFQHDPYGFFTIFVDHDKKLIRVEFYEPLRGDVLVPAAPNVKNSRLVRIIEGATAEEVRHTVCRLGLLSRLEHAAYLGSELAKAELALKYEVEYEQDKEIIIRK